MSQGQEAATAGRQGYGRAWYAVGVLLLLYCLSFTDRLILSLIAAPVTESLNISDTQLGLLFGVGFGVLYALAGLPLAQLIDRSHRVRIVSIGVALWSICTIASGFAQTFTELLVLRSGVAIGEAVLSPAAISIIADLFPREKRTLPTAVYTSVGIFMGAGALVAGGLALDIAGLFAQGAQMEPWRLALVVVGLPGLIIAPIFLLTVREPVRKVEPGTGDFATARQAIAYVRSEARLYGWLFVGIGALAIVSFSFQGWAPTILIRGYGLSPQQVGYVFGTIGTIGGIAGAVVAPSLAAAWTRKGRRDALIILLAGGAAVATSAAFVTGVTRTESVVMVAVGVLFFFASAGTLLMPLLVQYVTPGRVRARIMAGYMMSSNLVGLAIGPALTAWISERFFTGPFALASALALVAGVFGPISATSILLARKRYVIALDAADTRERATQAAAN